MFKCQTKNNCEICTNYTKTKFSPNAVFNSNELRFKLKLTKKIIKILNFTEHHANKSHKKP